MHELPNGKIIKNPQKGKVFKIGDVQHDESYLTEWEKDGETLKKNKILNLDEEPFDQKNYRSIGKETKVEDGKKVIVHSIEPKMSPLELKKNRIRDVRSDVSALLQPTRWYQERELDNPGIESMKMPENVRTYRNAIRAKCEEISESIKALTSYETVISFKWEDQWPEPVEAEEPIDIARRK